MVQWHIRSGDWVGYWGNIVGAVLGAIVASVLSIWISQTIQKNAEIEQIKYNSKMQITFDGSVNLLRKLNQIKDDSNSLDNYAKNITSSFSKLKNQDLDSSSFMSELNHVTRLLQDDNSDNDENFRGTVRTIQKNIDAILGDKYFVIYKSTIGGNFEVSLQENKDALEKFDDFFSSYDNFFKRYTSEVEDTQQEEKCEKIRSIFVNEQAFKNINLPSNISKYSEKAICELLDSLSLEKN